MARKKRMITDAEKQMFLSLKPDDITASKFNELFSDRVDNNTLNTDNPKIIPSKFNTFDEMKLSAGEYFNTEPIITNCGLFIFNKYLIEPYFQKEVGYVNFEMSKSGLNKVSEKIVSYMILDETDEYTTKYIEYLNRLCWLAFTVNTQICSSLNINSVKPLPKVTKRKQELIKEYKEEIENNDAIAYTKVQNELVELAKEELKDDPSYELYASGARGSFDNAYRQWLCTKGPIWNASKGEFEIVTNSLHEGVPKENMPAMANAIVSGFYPKAIGTGECGYITKQLSAAFQSVVLDERGSDCSTNHVATVHLTKDNVQFYLYHFIKSGNKYIRLEPSNQNNYIGKTVQMRLPDFCKGSKLCNRCAGDIYYLLGIDNIGLTFGRVSNTMLNAKMKKSHDSTVKVCQLDPEDIFV